MLKIEFATDNAAFGDDDADRADAVASILHAVSLKIANGETRGPIRDLNGNKVGCFSLSARA